MAPLSTFAGLKPATTPFDGRVRAPGSKSITNRALLIASLAAGTSRLSGVLHSDDTRYMRAALMELGVVIEDIDDTTIQVKGAEFLNEPKQPLFLGNAGTAIRFLAAAAVLVNGTVTLDGDNYMRKRPIQALLDAITQMGKHAESVHGCPPVTIKSNGLVDYQTVMIDGSLSSQFVSAIMMISALAKEPVTIDIGNSEIGGRGYIDATIKAMEDFGGRVQEKSRGVFVVQPTKFASKDFVIEADASTATYFWAAEALVGGHIDLDFDAGSSSQPDASAREIINQFPNLSGTIYGHQMQDAIPTLAVLAAFNNSAVRFTGLANLRVKECDRIEALNAGLNELHPGIARVEGDDLLVSGGLSGLETSQNVFIDSNDDHRIAMSFALAGLRRKNVYVSNPSCVAKTFPEFWNTFSDLGVEIGELSEQIG